MRQQVALDLRYRVHGHADHDQERCAAEVERNGRVRDQDFGNETHNGEIERANNGDARENIIDVLSGSLARADAGDKAAVLLQIVGGLRRVEHDRRVKEGKKHDERDVEDEKQRPAVAKQRGYRRQPIGPLARVEIGNRGRQQKQRRSENRRNYARRIEFERQMRGLALEHAVADLTLRILDQQAALRAFHENDKADDSDGHHDHRKDQTGRQCALSAEFECPGDR